MTMETNNTTTKHNSRSDLLCCLENLKRLFEASLDALSDISRHSLRLALAFESRLLFTKLDQMEARWRFHLPFTEAYDVDFKYWGTEVRNWQEYLYGESHREVIIDYEPISLNDSFYIDLCNALTSSGKCNKHTMEMSVSDYLISQKSVLSEFNKRRGDFKYAIEQNLIKLMKQDHPDSPGYIVMKESGGIGSLLNDKLRILWAALYEMDAILSQDHSDAVYADYYDRILQHHFQSEISRASSVVKEWCRNQQESDLLTEAKVQVRLLSAELTSLHPFKDIRDRVDFSKALSVQHAVLGRYIFNRRQQLQPVTNGTQTCFDNFRKAVYLLSSIEQYQQVEQISSLNDTKRSVALSPLPNCFSYELRSNPRSTRKFLAILREKQPLVGKRLRESNGALRWGHFYEAFLKGEPRIMLKETTPTEFGRAIAGLLDGVTAQNVTRNSQSDRFSKDGIGKAIIDDLFIEFQSIWT